MAIVAAAKRRGVVQRAIHALTFKTLTTSLRVAVAAWSMGTTLVNTMRYAVRTMATCSLGDARAHGVAVRGRDWGPSSDDGRAARRRVAWWAVALVAVMCGCSYESDWHPQRSDATVSPTDARSKDAPLDEARGDVADARDDLHESRIDVGSVGDAGDVLDVTMDAKVSADVPVDTWSDAMDADAADARDVDVVSSDRDAADVADVTDAGDARADVPCTDACSADESCYAGTCRAQRSCAPGDAGVGCGLVDLTGGTFTMNRGAATGEHELPGVTIRGFTMDVHEVTVARFREFWNVAGHPAPAAPIRYPNGTLISTMGSPLREPGTGGACNWGRDASRDDHPINCVDKVTAQAFCEWDAGGARHGGRLPTSAEWEFAATGGARTYPWGNSAETACPTMPLTTLILAHGILGGRTCAGEDGASTLRVGRFAANPSGLRGLAGNVGEWVADLRGPAEYNELCWWASESNDPLCASVTSTDPSRFVVRGGGFGDSLPSFEGRAAAHTADAVSPSVGFRCARTRSEADRPDNGNDPSATCAAGMASCAGACIDPMTHNLHCGRCANACASGRQRCVEGRCVEAQASCAVAGTPGCGVTLVRGGVPFDTLPGVDVTDGGQVSARVSVSSFAMDTYEVTVARFRAFREAAFRAPSVGIRYPSGAVVVVPAVQEPRTWASNPLCNWMATPARDDHPMNCVDKNTAQAFCAWDSNGGRLPTRAEWEYAARGVDRVGVSMVRRWPWGDTDDPCNRARLGPMAGCGVLPGGAGPNGTFPVGAAVAGPSYQPYGGFFDLIGNLSEWTVDYRRTSDITRCWGPVPDAGVLTDPVCLDPPGDFVSYIAGAGFDQVYRYTGIGVRGGSGTDSMANTGIGIRCVRSVSVPAP